MNTVLLIITIVFAGLAALLHVYIWVMESLWWTRPSIWKRFGIRSEDEAETIKPMALNQGFYNLFLAIGAAAGILLLPSSALRLAGIALILLACGSMLAASLVLVISNPKMVRAAATQGLFPLLAVITIIISGVVTMSAGTA